MPRKNGQSRKVISVKSLVLLIKYISFRDAWQAVLDSVASSWIKLSIKRLIKFHITGEWRGNIPCRDNWRPPSHETFVQRQVATIHQASDLSDHDGYNKTVVLLY